MPGMGYGAAGPSLGIRPLVPLCWNTLRRRGNCPFRHWDEGGSAHTCLADECIAWPFYQMCVLPWRRSAMLTEGVL
jgi:hypothetical protein